jgi:hypothetical protein
MQEENLRRITTLGMIDIIKDRLQDIIQDCEIYYEKETKTVIIYKYMILGEVIQGSIANWLGIKECYSIALEQALEGLKIKRIQTIIKDFLTEELLFFYDNGEKFDYFNLK